MCAVDPARGTKIRCVGQLDYYTYSTVYTNTDYLSSDNSDDDFFTNQFAHDTSKNIAITADYTYNWKKSPFTSVTHLSVSQIHGLLAAMVVRQLVW